MIPFTLTDLQFDLLCKAADAKGPRKLTKLLSNRPEAKLNTASKVLEQLGFLKIVDEEELYRNYSFGPIVNTGLDNWIITPEGKEYLEKPTNIKISIEIKPPLDEPDGLMFRESNKILSIITNLEKSINKHRNIYPEPIIESIHIRLNNIINNL